MILIDQRTKKIMEECKARARDAGLRFDDESLEYIVTNQDMLELSPKVMIPTLYDYWVHDVEVLKEYGKYKLYPSNPYETVINSRPAISYYNDNNPDWMNIMIFYHVIGHIDFFQNNVLFEHTWNDDFVGQALADKRLINQYRSQYGRWVDYAIEFSRSIDNITGYFNLIARNNFPNEKEPQEKIKYYFDHFLQEEKRVPHHHVFKEIAEYNELISKNPAGNSVFFSEVKRKFPEFQSKFEKYLEKEKVVKHTDLLEFIRDNSPFLDKEENGWMKQIMTIIRNTSLYFAPQIRTKTINEGWASYWHDKLFKMDERIKGHEVVYAKLNAGVTSISRVGLNPYAIGLRLIEHVEELANKGKINYEFQKIKDIERREDYDTKAMKGNEAIFKLRSDFSDFMLFNTFVDQDFIDEHDLFVAGKRYNQQRNTWQYYVQSRKAEDYQKMLMDSLYHPPSINVDLQKTNDDLLYLRHEFEGKQLIKPFIPETLIGVEYLWGGEVNLETTEIVKKSNQQPNEKPEYFRRKVLYIIKNRKISKKNL